MKHESSISHTLAPKSDPSWDNLTPCPESPLSPADRFRVNPNNYTILINQDELDIAQKVNAKIISPIPLLTKCLWCARLINN